jgi:hypothetical protein
VFELDVDLPAELVPLSWLIGVWEGSGVLAYKVGDDIVEREFGQRVSFSHDGTPHLTYRSDAWLLPEPGASDAEASVDGPVSPQPLFSEIGFWRLSRPLGDGDTGPGMLPATAAPVFQTADEVETLRNADGAFEIEVLLVQPGGVSELYLGQIKGPRIDLASDAVLRSATAKEYSSATRLYGLVDNHLLWAWDIAALGQSLRTHASGRLARAE